jgi:hypothetical protein
MAGLDFDIDPLKGLNFGGQGGGSARSRPLYRKPLGDEDFRSVGQQALDAGSSGISHVLGAIDKPGQAVRGVLAGKGIGSLKHLVPFSDTMGLTTEKDHTTGRDLTDMAGITDKGDKGWGAWGAGLAADIATDPLSYSTFGAKHALTPIGALVKKTGALKSFTGKQMIQGFHGVEPTLAAAGNTASDIAHMADQGKKIASGAAAATGVQANQPLSSLVRIGLPFGGPGVNIGTGQTAQKIAGVLGKAGDYLKYGNPVGRAIGSKFDASRHGAVGKITQKGATEYLDPALRELKRDARGDRSRLIQQLDPLVSAPGANEIAVNDATRAVAEGVPHPFGQGLAAQVDPAANHVKGVGVRQMEEAREAGAPLKDANDPYVNYVHRSSTSEAPGSLQIGGKGQRANRLLETTSGANIGREEIYRGIPGGTNRINNWFDRYAGVKRSQKANAAAINADMVTDLQAGGNLLTYTPQVARRLEGKSAAMSRRVAAASPVYRTTPDAAGKPFFSPGLVSDVTQRGQQHAKTVASTKAAVGIMTDNARPVQAGNPEGLVPLHDLAKKLGLETTDSDLALRTPMRGALVQIYKGLAKHGVGKVDPYLYRKTSDLAFAVNQFGVTPEHAAELLKAHTGWHAPEQIKSTLGAFDSITNAFKALAYPIWIPSHVRNAGTAAVNNARHGVGLRDYADQLQTMTGRGARDLSGIHPSLAGLSPAQQVEELRHLQYTHANIYGGHGMNEEIAGNVKTALQDGKRFTPQVPGSDRAGKTGNLLGDTADLVLKQGLGGSLAGTGKAIGGSLAGLFNPSRKWGQSISENLGIKGVGGAAKDTLPAVKAGRAAGTNVEDFFRGALFNKLGRGGHSPGVAADASDALHFDYDALTGFEKNVMRRAMPFYTYARKNLPLQLETMIHQPGILQAQSKPFNQEQPGGKGYVPKYLNSGYAIPVGDEKDGNRKYVSKLGLPAEEAFEKLHFQNGLPDIRRTLLAQLGGLNPLVKAPAEQLSGIQFHTQRQLADLHAPKAASAIGHLLGEDNPQMLSQVMSNSPFTRFVSSADKLMDPRKSWGQKALNLATGVKVTDVNVDKQRAIDTRNALKQIMDGHPNLSRYSSFYVKPEDAKDLTPEEIELMRAYATQQAQAKVYAKSQRIGMRP